MKDVGSPRTSVPMLQRPRKSAFRVDCEEMGDSLNFGQAKRSVLAETLGLPFSIIVRSASFPPCTGLAGILREGQCTPQAQGEELSTIVHYQSNHPETPYP